MKYILNQQPVIRLSIYLDSNALRTRNDPFIYYLI